MSENLFLGDTTYPHEIPLISRLRKMGVSRWNSIGTEAADRIEKLEQQLAEAQQRYEFMRDLTPSTFNVIWFEHLKGNGKFCDFIDAKIKEQPV